MQARALAATGELDAAMAMLRSWSLGAPEDPEPLYWGGRLAIDARTLSARALAMLLEKLEQWPGDGTAQAMAEELRAAAVTAARSPTPPPLE